MEIPKACIALSNAWNSFCVYFHQDRHVVDFLLCWDLHHSPRIDVSCEEGLLFINFCSVFELKERHFTRKNEFLFLKT